jgi:sugar phosphate isomerase/epimerase
MGVMDGVAGKASDPAAVEVAKRLDFDGLQVTLGRRKPDGSPMPLSSPELAARFVEESKRQKVPLIATYIDMLHVDCLKSDPKALADAVEGIAITKRLGAPILMLVFFGKCALESRAEMDAVVAPLKELSREAEKAGVVLGFENTIPAEDDARILDQVGSRALKVYYDIGNATNLYNAEPDREIRFLKDRICQFHFKDKGYLGTGKVDVRAALEAMATVGYKGYAVLETGSPAKDIEADLRRNLTYVKKVNG